VNKVKYLLEQFLGSIAALREEGVSEYVGGYGTSGIFTGNNDDRDVGKTATDDGKELEAAHIGHPEVGNYDVWHGLLKGGKTLETISTGVHLISFGLQKHFAHLQHFGFVVNDENAVAEWITGHGLLISGCLLIVS
jgi:hypothetical protein